MTKLSVRIPQAGNFTQTTNKIDYDYDAEGNLEKSTSPQGEVGYDYNNVTGQKTAVKIFTSPDGVTFTLTGQTDYGYDALGRLETAARDSVGASYTYNAVGSLETVTYGNGITATYSYDALNRLDTLVWQNASAAVIASYDYDVYADGQRRKVTEPGGKVTQWSYDNLNRLNTESIVGGYTHNYTYDLAGNRVTFNNGTSTVYYQRNAKDQILAESPNADYSSPSITYGYDDNGSLTSQAVAGGNTTIYGYNLQNRLATATTGGSPSLSYRYDDQGSRIGKQVGTSPVNHYLMDAFNPTGYAQVIEDNDGHYVIGNDVFAQVTSGGAAYFIYDGQGSVRYLANASGALISGQTFDYDAYGNRMDASAAQTNLLYTGEWHDADLNWNYNRDRWSIPSLGIFNQPDRFSGYNTDPQSLHKYLYCHADPVNNIDSLGLFTSAFGQLAHRAIQDIYEIDHPRDKGNILYGKWTRLGSKLLQAYRLKPDIINHTGYHNENQKTWLEIKPLSISGVADGVGCYNNYNKQFSPFGYFPEASWVPSTHYTYAGQVEIFFFNAGGIIFYTDITENIDDLLKLGSATVVAQYIRSAVGKQFTQSIVNSSSQIPRLVKLRPVADKQRLSEHIKIAAMFALMGYLM